MIEAHCFLLCWIPSFSRLKNFRQNPTLLLLLLGCSHFEVQSSICWSIIFWSPNTPNLRISDVSIFLSFFFLPSSLPLLPSPCFSSFWSSELSIIMMKFSGDSYSCLNCRLSRIWYNCDFILTYSQRHSTYGI